MRGPMVAAPLGSPQSPFPGRGQPPGPPPPPPGATGPVKVAVLLPLSGANAELGKAMLEAAQMALFTTGNDRLTLVPRDTSGTPDGAANAARAVIAEGAQLILGPLLAAEVDAVKPVAGEAKINVIAFSTATQLAGDNVFLMGFLPRQEVVREVSFARESGASRRDGRQDRNLRPARWRCRPGGPASARQRGSGGCVRCGTANPASRRLR